MDCTFVQIRTGGRNGSIADNFYAWPRRSFFNEEIKARRQERSWDEYWAKYEAEQAPRLLEERRIKLKMCVDNEF